VNDRVDDGPSTSGSPPAEASHEASFLIVARLAAVALLALLVPLAGVFALAGLVVLWLFRSRIEISTLLVVYALVLFLVPSRYTVGPFAVTAAMAVGLLALLLWGYGRALGTTNVRPHRNGARNAVIVFLLVTVAFYGWRMLFPILSLDQRNADRNIAVIIALCGVAIAIIEGLRDRQQLNQVLGALVVGGALVALLAYLQFFAKLDIAQYIRPPGFKAIGHEGFTYERDGIRRVAGTARHPIEFGLALAATLPIALHFAAWARTAAARSASVVASVMIAGAIPLALSRAAVLAFIVVGVLVFPTWSSRRRWRAVGAVALILLTMSLAAPDILPEIGGLITQKEGTGSLTTRGNATDIAFELINERPAFGHGFASGFDSPVVVDNQYLVTTIETGFVGLVVLLGLLATGLAVGRRARRLSSDPATRDLAQSLVATIAAIAIGGFALNVVRFPMTAGILFVGIGAVGALVRFEREDAARLVAVPVPPPGASVGGSR
jgi:polysaccharide biosynthesis protein PslJ